jgi:hypothetical protein
MSEQIPADEAVDTGISQSAHIIQDGTVDRSTARMMTYSAALDVLGSSTGNLDHPGTRCAWLVTLEGMFYEPSGPAGGPPRQKVCGRIDLILPESGGDYSDLTSRETGEC